MPTPNKSHRRHKPKQPVKGSPHHLHEADNIARIRSDDAIQALIARGTALVAQCAQQGIASTEYDEVIDSLHNDKWMRTIVREYHGEHSAKKEITQLLTLTIEGLQQTYDIFMQTQAQSLARRPIQAWDVSPMFGQRRLALSPRSSPRRTANAQAQLWGERRESAASSLDLPSLPAEISPHANAQEQSWEAAAGSLDLSPLPIVGGVPPATALSPRARKAKTDPIAQLGEFLRAQAASEEYSPLFGAHSHPEEIAYAFRQLHLDESKAQVQNDQSKPPAKGATLPRIN